MAAKRGRQPQQRRTTSPSGSGRVVRLHIQPRAAKTEVAGRHGEAVKIRVKAPPVGGAANDELVRFLAKHFAVPRSSIELVSGAGSRQKRITIQGLSSDEIVRALLD
ncbi:MAG: YggU family protein [Gemmatimonadetes bacterium]|nr:YggU family protein [Gemmatimonadota bacterium]MCH7716311.1 YggU family protein [Gemmatimonadota bacterium]